MQHPDELLGVLQVVRAHAAAAAGVGDEAVEAAVGVDVGGDERGDVVLVGDVGDDRLHRTPSIALATSTSLDSVRPQIVTEAPSAASRRAQAAPMPVPPPVTMTLLPSRLSMVLLVVPICVVRTGEG